MNRYYCFLALLCTILYFTSCSTFQEVTPNYPKKVNQLIKKQIEDIDASNYYLGVSDTIMTEEFEIWYESIGDVNDPTILLINGFRAPASTWSSEFILDLVNEGYHVVKIDNRDVGLSHQVTSNKKDITYSLKEMANDGILVMNKLGINKFHLVGSSMGGMIAQTMAIHYPNRINSMISIASTGHLYDAELKTMTFSTLAKAGIIFIKYGVKDRNLKQAVKRRIEAEAYLRSDAEITEEWIESVVRKNIYERERGAEINKKAIKRHRQAIRISGSRLEELPKIPFPVLVIHGKKDPLILPEHAEKYAQCFSNSTLVMLDDFGHVPSKEEEKVLSEYILEFVGKI